jgi:hypothetical protein
MLRSSLLLGPIKDLFAGFSGRLLAILLGAGVFGYRGLVSTGWPTVTVTVLVLGQGGARVGTVGGCRRWWRRHSRWSIPTAW